MGSESKWPMQNLTNPSIAMTKALSHVSICIYFPYYSVQIMCAESLFIECYRNCINNLVTNTGEPGLASSNRIKY